MTIAVELDPKPSNSGGRARDAFLMGAGELKRAGANLITLADNPRAEARGDSAALSILLSLETGIETMPHISCKHRNEIALKSALLALDIAGIRQVLAVSGDPVPAELGASPAPRRQLDAAGLARLIAEWGRDCFSAPFTLSAALDLNAPNFDAELHKAVRKADSGVTRFLTQPVLSWRALGNLARAREVLASELLGGILPVVSAANADFLARGGMPGIALDDWVAPLYRGRGRSERDALAVGLSLSFARRMAPFVDGYYLITPFSRTDIIAELIPAIRRQSDERKEVAAASALPDANPDFTLFT
jgi:methionine synthase / methylenetetrahydrofolate reductase(NADPH)